MIQQPIAEMSEMNRRLIELEELDRWRDLDLELPELELPDVDQNILAVYRDREGVRAMHIPSESFLDRFRTEFSHWRPLRFPGERS